MIEHHQPPHPGVTKQALGTAKQTPLKTAVDQRQPVNFAGGGFHRRHVGPPLVDERMILADYFRYELNRATRIVPDVPVDRGLARLGLQFTIDVGG